MRPGHMPLNPAEDEPDSIRPGLPASVRKKAAGVRPWLLLDASGQGQVVEAGKHAIMRRTGLPARDLRILDPLLSYPSTVLGRERAVVINLEHIKAIITAQEVLLLNSRDPSVTPFVEELQRRIVRHHQATKSQDAENGTDDTDWRNLYDLEGPLLRARSPSQFPDGFPGKPEESKVDENQALVKQNGLKVLPFEFIVLEACLEAACSVLDNEARTLEQEAQPALDKLTSKISTLNLERVRHIKSRLVAITGRVQKVRDELEHLLDDDEDMAEMYLTEKMVQQNLEISSQSSMNEQDGTNDEVPQSEMDDRIPVDVALEGNGGSATYEGEQLFGTSYMIGRHEHGPHPSITHTSTTRSAISKHLDVDELEMLLEAYFVQIDGTLNKLSTLREYVDDTDDFINIMLDDKQNQLLQMGIMLSTATLVLSAFVVVAGIMGMNIRIDLFNTGMTEFLWTVGGCSFGSLFLYVIAIAWCKHRGLLE